MTDRTTHLISIAIIIIFAGSTIWWMKHSYDHDIAAEHYTEHIKDYPLLDPALPFYDKDDLIVNIEDIRMYLRDLPEQNKDWAEICTYFEVLSTGANASINNEHRILPASLAKLPIGMAAMKKVEEGEWSLETSFELKQEDIAGNTTITEVGKKYKVSELMFEMLSRSDNASWRVLVRNMNDEDVLGLGESVGLDDTFITSDKISSKEFTRLFRALHSATFLNEENSQYLLDLLSKDEFDGYLKAGLPPSVTFSHKWGINLEHNIYADSGIVYFKNRPVVLSVFIEAKTDNDEENTRKANEVMKSIAERVTKGMSR